MRVLVTGASGFVAGHLIPYLAARGDEVVALAYDVDRAPTGERIEHLQHDLRTPLETLDGIDAVVHLAQANVSFPEGAQDLFLVNTAATQRLLELSLRSGVERVVHASSGSVYGLREGVRNEEDPLLGTDFYSATKRASELLVTAYADRLRTTIVRPFAPYGPRQTRRLIPGLVERVRSGQPVVLRDGGRPRITPIFVGDVVRVLAAALDDDRNHLVNLAGDDVVGIGELAREIGAVLGREPVFEHEPGGIDGDLIGANERMLSLLRRRPVTLRDGLRATIEAEALI